MYDYGARLYDPVISRWAGVDPLAEKYYSIGQYDYTDNNPVNNIDPNGMEIYYGNEARAVVDQIKSELSTNEDEDPPKRKRSTSTSLGQSYINGVLAGVNSTIHGIADQFTRIRRIIYHVIADYRF